MSTSDVTMRLLPRYPLPCTLVPSVTAVIDNKTVTSNANVIKITLLDYAMPLPPLLYDPLWMILADAKDQLLGSMLRPDGGFIEKVQTPNLPHWAISTNGIGYSALPHSGVSAVKTLLMSYDVVFDKLLAHLSHYAISPLPPSPAVGDYSFGMILAPKFHLLMHVEVGASSTVVVMRTDYWRVYAYIDELFASIFE